MFDKSHFPLGVALVTAAAGLSLQSPSTALLAGLVGYVLIKIIQSTVWTLFGDPRA